MRSENRTRWVILGCLTLEPMSGYDVKAFVDRTIVHFWSESYGQLYPTLKALEAQGLVTGRHERQEGRPDKRVYTITEAGRAALAAWLAEPAEPVVPRYEHSLKIFFGASGPPEAALDHVRRLREESAAALAAYREREVEVEARLGDSEHAPYRLAVLTGGIRYAEAVLAWCDEAEALLEAHAPPGN